MASSGSRGPWREVIASGSQAPDTKKKSASARGELGVKFAQYKPEQGAAQIAAKKASNDAEQAKLASWQSEVRSTGRRKGVARIAAVGAGSRAVGRYYKKEEEKIKELDNKAEANMAVEILKNDGEDGFKTLLHEMPHLRGVLRNSLEIAEVRARRKIQEG